MENQKITKKELDDIRSLTDFDLTMFLSEVHDHGWPLASLILPTIVLSSLRERAEGKPN